MSGGANPTRIIEARTVPEPVPVPGAHFRRRRSHQMAGGQSTALDQWSGASNWPNMSKPCHHRESRQFVHPLATATSTASKDSAGGRAEAGRSRLGVARGGRSGESGGRASRSQRRRGVRRNGELKMWSGRETTRPPLTQLVPTRTRALHLNSR